MAKLTLLALAVAALVAFAAAHTTIVTTTIQDEYPFSEQRQCSRHLQGQRLNQCRMFLQQQGQIPYNWGRQQQQQHPQQQQEMLQQCCQQLQNVEEQCQCEAVKQVFREAQQERQQRGQIVPFLGSQQTQQLKQKAQALPNLCNLQSQQCQIGSIAVTFTESSSDSEMRRPFGSRSQQCRESEIQRPVSQCQRYVEQQMQQQQQPGRRQQQHQQQQPEGLEECCNELQNVERECQCQAVEEVARRVIRQPHQRHQQQQQQQQQHGMDIARRLIQNLPNQCNLEVRQCSNIPYGWI